MIRTLLLIALFTASSLLYAQDGNGNQEPIYIDVRTWLEHKFNHIDGDPRIHISEIVDGVEQQFPDKSTPIRLYCAAGVRSGRGVEKLKQAGYLNVQNVGGIEDVKKLRAKAQDDTVKGE